jgi:hypothetical protein
MKPLPLETAASDYVVVGTVEDDYYAMLRSLDIAARRRLMRYQRRTRAYDRRWLERAKRKTAGHRSPHGGWR